MRYRDVSLTDFGIYQSARLDDLPEGIGVIAGPQRAGKTTFMQALRQLPFGINRGNALPPASREYELGATITNNTGEYSLRITGQQAPRIASLDDAPELTQPALVGGLSKDQYQQLFTLSLRELQRIPDSLDDEEQLSEILLGAAYGNIADVPALRDRFASHAKSIGGKRGRASYQLRAVVDDIDQAVSEREAAKRTVDRYENRQAKLSEIEAEIDALDAEASKLEAERSRLSILDKWFDELDQYREASAKLAELTPPSQEYEENASENAASLVSDLHDAASTVANAQRELTTYTERDDIAAYADQLEDAAATIERYDRQVEKWRDQEQTLTATEDELDEQRRDLVQRVEALRSVWTSLDDVRSVTVDTLTNETVREQTTRVEDLREVIRTNQKDVESTGRELRELRTELETAEAELDATAADEARSERASLVGAGIALLGLLVGAAVGVASSPLPGYAVAGVGILAGFLYTRRHLQSTTTEVDAEPVRELKAAISNRRSHIAGLETELESLNNELETAEADLAELRAQFDLPEDVVPAGIREFYDSVDTLRRDIRGYDDDVTRYGDTLDAYEATLNEVATDLDGLAASPWDTEVPRTHSEALFAAVEQTAEAVDAAAELTTAQAALLDVRSEAIAVLSSWTPVDRPNHSEAELEALSTTELIDELEAFERAAAAAAAYRDLEAQIEQFESQIQREFERSTVVEAFHPVLLELRDEPAGERATAESETYDSPVAAVPALEQLADQYATKPAITSRQETIATTLDELQQDHEELRNRRAEVKETLKTLASDDDLKAADTTIQRHRERLQSLGESYAVNRIAETLLDELHDQFLEQATGPLLDEASEIFNHLTETYDGVSHAGDLDSLRFEALRPDGNTRSPDTLSRATAEQLFLSIRLARIRQFDQSLPVVIDDAMTNFDPAHTRRTLAFLDELARSHQIILLTCHPEVLRLTDDVSEVDGYWTLDDGQFDGPLPDPTPAIEFLDAE